eukprot:1601085-Pleurochrysis_carterae.AAC.1
MWKAECRGWLKVAARARQRRGARMALGASVRLLHERPCASASLPSAFAQCGAENEKMGWGGAREMAWGFGAAVVVGAAP